MRNDMLDLIKTRRSIRKYRAEQIADEALDAVLEAGTYAPSGKGKQVSTIVAVQDQETLQKLARMNAEVLGRDIDPYYAPPTIVLVFADPQRPTYIQDASCVLENMMLAAHALGLGSCWINREREMFETQEGKALMKKWGLDETLKGVGALSLGYIKGNPPKAAKRKENYIIKV